MGRRAGAGATDLPSKTLGWSHSENEGGWGLPRHSKENHHRSRRGYRPPTGQAPLRPRLSVAQGPLGRTASLSHASQRRWLGHEPQARCFLGRAPSRSQLSCLPASPPQGWRLPHQGHPPGPDASCPFGLGRGKTSVHGMSGHNTARRTSQEMGTVGWGLLGPWPGSAGLLVFADHARSSLGSMPLQVSA